VPPPKISHNQRPNNELNETPEKYMGGWHEIYINVICKKDWDYAPLHTPCNKDKRMVTMDIIWHARCAGQLAVMQI
jgi:hypothetical protein